MLAIVKTIAADALQTSIVRTSQHTRKSPRVYSTRKFMNACRLHFVCKGKERTCLLGSPSASPFCTFCPSMVASCRLAHRISPLVACLTTSANNSHKHLFFSISVSAGISFSAAIAHMVLYLLCPCFLAYQLHLIP